MQPLKTSKCSLAIQAKQYLFNLIKEGAYQAGQQLPSEIELANQLGISRPTLREALHHLQQEGVIVRKHGVGTFVASDYGRRLESGLERLESVLELAARQDMQVQVGSLQVQQAPADAELAESLQIDPGAELTSVQRVIVVDDTPVAFLLDFVPACILAVEDIDQNFNGSVLDLLRQKQGLGVSHAVADILPLIASASLSQKLGVSRGKAILLVEEILFDKEGQIVEFSRNYFVPAFFRFHVIRR